MTMADCVAQWDPEVVAEVRAMDRHRLEEFFFTVYTLEQDRGRLLEAIPGGPAHGTGCVPHAMAWIEAARRGVPGLAPDEAPPLLDVVELVRAAAGDDVADRLAALEEDR